MMLSTLKSLAIDEIPLKQLTVNGVLAWIEPSSYTDQVPISINTDGSIYNGIGYKNGYRVRSGGAEAAESTSVCCGFIPFKVGDTLHISPAFFGANTQNAINFSDENFTNLGQITGSLACYGICASTSANQTLYRNALVTTDNETTFTLTENHLSSEKVAYIRITHGTTEIGTNGFTATVNEEISL